MESTREVRMAISSYRNQSKSSPSRRTRQSQRAQIHRQTAIQVIRKGWRRSPYHDDVPAGEEHLPIRVANNPTISIRGGGSGGSSVPTQTSTTSVKFLEDGEVEETVKSLPVQFYRRGLLLYL